MMRISVVFTEHEENGAADTHGLVAILERIQPEVIFLECPQTGISNFFERSYHRLEANAVSRYRDLHRVELFPVDLPTPEAALFENLRKVIDKVARTGPDYDRFARCHRQYVEAH